MTQGQSQAHGLIFGDWPAVVHSYNPDTRECRVRVPGLSEGADEALLAEIRYPIGDVSKAGAFSTDILLLPGDDVWIAFIGGDPRYPLITGMRCPQTGNGTGWRRWHQANIELLAQAVMNLIAGGVITIKSEAQVLVQAPSVTIDTPQAEITGNLSVGGNVAIAGGIGVAGGGSGGSSTIAGNFAIEGGSLTHNGKDVGSSHTHTSGGEGAATSPPN